MGPVGSVGCMGRIMIFAHFTAKNRDSYRINMQSP